MLLKINHLFVIIFITTALLFMVIPFDADAQCPMCKGIAESSLKEGNTAAKGLNAGILYLLATPYLLVGFFSWRLYMINKKKS